MIERKYYMLQCTHSTRAVPWQPLVENVWRQKSGRGLWAWLALCSLVVCCGTRTDSWGGLECPTGTVVGPARTPTHVSQVSRVSWCCLWWRDFEFIHPPAFNRQTKTLSRVWGAVEFDTGRFAPWKARCAVRTGFIPLSARVGRLLWSWLCLFSFLCKSCGSGWVVNVNVRTPQWLGWVTKNGRTCGKIGVNVELSGQESAWHGSGARSRRTDLAHDYGRSIDPRVTRLDLEASGNTSDRMKGFVHTKVPKC